VAPFHKIQKDLWVVKELCKNKVGPSIYFLFEKSHLCCCIPSALWMTFGETGDCNAKVVAVFTPDQANQLGGVFKASANRRPRHGSLGGIPSESKNVSYASILNMLQHDFEIVNLHVCAS